MKLRSSTLRAVTIGVVAMLPAHIAFAKAKKPDPFDQCVREEIAKDRNAAAEKAKAERAAKEAEKRRKAEAKAESEQARKNLIAALKKSTTCTSVAYFKDGKTGTLPDYYKRLDGSQPTPPREGIRCDTSVPTGESTSKKGVAILSVDRIDFAQSNSTTLTVTGCDGLTFTLAPNAAEGNRLVPTSSNTATFTFSDAELAANARDAVLDFVSFIPYPGLLTALSDRERAFISESATHPKTPEERCEERMALSDGVGAAATIRVPEPFPLPRGDGPKVRFVEPAGYAEPIKPPPMVAPSRRTSGN